MNIKTTVTLSERNLRYAEKMVEEGAYPSLSDLVEASIEQMILNTRSSDDAVSDMADEIRKRLELPRDQWVKWDGKKLLDNIKSRLATDGER
ncbi:hypothetical protein [Pararhizobium antarcticum]|uniref:CopG family transcriptional regulator n=1 Tax=Pararhizobium antarcticum TaxID=1798805 RepID=A0A657LWZ9_9HYPH|nr:hypothetical protein [Pararhizobium antarcticum]OJF90417.1 hypothetical protein AX761_07110 [Rhizobium sp. 58]OJG00520.1 hypothetical protein AX760_10080 [Pararhizobium antarcticum]